MNPWINRTMRRSRGVSSSTVCLVLAVILASALGVLSEEPELGSARVVFQVPCSLQPENRLSRPIHFIRVLLFSST